MEELEDKLHSVSGLLNSMAEMEEMRLSELEQRAAVAAVPQALEQQRLVMMALMARKLWVVMVEQLPPVVVKEDSAAFQPDQARQVETSLAAAVAGPAMINSLPPVRLVACD